jgi:2-desacetyl-2-hydroxyethyl bacteriochlorophyllide A dehydrogenase
MKAAIFVKPGKIEVQEVEIPKIKENEVLIKVEYCGICGTDRHIFNGVYSRDKLPLIAGHEFSGTIAQIGKNVHGLKEGQKVTADINLSCGTCYYCRHDQPLMCSEMRQLGIHIDGAFAEYVAVPQEKVYMLAANMDFQDAALLEPISCVVRGQKKVNLKMGESVAIIGDGAIALMHVQMARLCGAAPIIVVGKHEERLEKAKELGADHTILVTEDVEGKVKDFTDGRGADVVIEVVGRIATYEQVFRLVRPGGKISAFGLSNEGEYSKLEPFKMVLEELSMVGSVAGVKNDLAEAITLVRYNRFKLDDFKRMIIPLENIGEAFERLKTDKHILKVLISIGNSVQ